MRRLRPRAGRRGMSSKSSLQYFGAQRAQSVRAFIDPCGRMRRTEPRARASSDYVPTFLPLLPSRSLRDEIRSICHGQCLPCTSAGIGTTCTIARKVWVPYGTKQGGPGWVQRDRPRNRARRRRRNSGAPAHSRRVLQGITENGYAERAPFDRDARAGFLQRALSRWLADKQDTFLWAFIS